MKKILAVCMLSFLLISPVTASAAGLTSAQVDAVLGLIKAFGGDAATLARAAEAMGSTQESQEDCQSMKLDSSRTTLFPFSSVESKRSAVVDIHIESCTKPESPAIVITYPATSTTNKPVKVEIPVAVSQAVKTKSVWSLDISSSVSGLMFKQGDYTVSFSYEDTDAELTFNVQKLSN